MFARVGAVAEIPEPPVMQAFLQSTQMIQDWSMFAPNPAVDSGWWVIDGKTENGERFDPLTGKPPTFPQKCAWPTTFTPKPP